MSRPPRRLRIDLLLEDDRPSGVVGDGRVRRGFSGWLGLLGVLDALMDRGQPTIDPTPRRSTMSTTATPTTPTDVVASLRERVSEVHAPGDPGWEAARTPWILNAGSQPVAVALPRDPAEVAATIAVARRSGLRVAPQGTGHGAGSLGDLSDAVLLRTSRMREVMVDPLTRRARVGAGVEWEEVTIPASHHGLVALHGSSPNVGVAGYALGGGIGWLARSRGLACNSVTAVEMVSAEGELVRADASHEPDLFWALRGGGGFFGVVTAIELELFPLESVHAGWLVWPWTRAEEVLSAWSEWVREAPEAVTSVGRILQVPDAPFAPEPIRGKALAVVEIAYAGDEDEGRELVRPLRALQPDMDTVAQVPASALVRLHQDPEDPMPVASGHGMLSELGPEAIRRFVELVGPGSRSPLLSTEIRHLGGAAGRPAPGGGALSHLEGQFALFALGVPMEPSQEAPLAAEAARVATEMSAFGGAPPYRNFADTRHGSSAFLGEESFARLGRVAQRFDPHRMLRANHDLDGAPRD